MNPPEGRGINPLSWKHGALLSLPVPSGTFGRVWFVSLDEQTCLPVGREMDEGSWGEQTCLLASMRLGRSGPLGREMDEDVWYNKAYL